MERDEYKYDVFISWTGKDREIKDKVKNYLIERGILEEKIFDSEYKCAGEFREECLYAISVSKVYLLLLGDNVANDPNISGNGYFSEVKSELNYALQFEARGKLNFVILNYSTFFKNPNIKYDRTNIIPFYFDTALAGFSRSDIIIDDDGIIDEGTLLKIFENINKFIESRDEGSPIPSVTPKIVLQKQGKFTEDELIGRTSEINEITNVFTEGAKVVVLSGLGGIGKTMIAKKYAEQLGAAICPQIVELPEDNEENRKNSLYDVLDQIIFTEDVCFGWNRLDDQRRYIEIERALASLPEYIILIIDNCNSLNNNMLEYFVNKLKCRVLFTTRVESGLSDFNKKVGFKKIDKLPFDNAYSLFLYNYNEDKNVLKQSISQEDFKKIYDFLDGHTITLTITARIMQAHQKTVDEMLQVLDEGHASEEVEFSHNSLESRNATIFSHLTSLFKFTNLRESSLNVLRNLALLRSGSIELDLLLKYMNLPNRNEINELRKYGWIQLYSIGKSEDVSLHNVISSLVNANLELTSINTNMIVNYLCDTSQSMIKKSEYSSLLSREESLYFALYRLAVHEKKLNPKLWELFTYINKMRGNPKDTQNKCQKLLLICEQDQSLIESHSDMMILMHSPNRIDIMGRYLNNLYSRAEEYKWVSRQLSVTLASIIQSNLPEHKDFVKKVLKNSIESAMYNKDDLAVFMLQTMGFIVPKNNFRLQIKSLKKYIRKRRKTEKTGELLLLDSLIFSQTILPLSSLTVKYADKYSNLIKELADLTRLSKAVSFIIKHPYFFLKCIQISMQQEKIINSQDPLAPYFRYAGMFGESVVEQGQFDFYSFIKAVIFLFTRLKEKGLTLRNYNFDAIFSLIDRVKINHPQLLKKFSEETKKIVESISLEYSLEGMTKYEISIAINRYLGDQSVIKQAEEYVEYVKRNNPKGSYVILDALFELANVYSKFELGKMATSIYLEIYEIIKENNLIDTTYTDRLYDNSLYWGNFIENSNLDYNSLYNNATTKMNFLKNMLDYAISKTKQYSSERVGYISRYLWHMRTILYQFERYNIIISEHKETLNKYYEYCDECKNNIIKNIKKYRKKDLDDILICFYLDSFYISSDYAQKTLSQLDSLQQSLHRISRKKIKWYQQLERYRINSASDRERYCGSLQALRFVIKNRIFRIGNYYDIREYLMHIVLKTFEKCKLDFGLLFYEMLNPQKAWFDDIIHLYNNAKQIDKCNERIVFIADEWKKEKFYLNKERRTTNPELYFYLTLKNILKSITSKSVPIETIEQNSGSEFYTYKYLTKCREKINVIIDRFENENDLEETVKNMLKSAIEKKVFSCISSQNSSSSEFYNKVIDSLITSIPLNATDVKKIKTMESKQIIDYVCACAYNCIESTKKEAAEANMSVSFYNKYVKDEVIKLLNQCWDKMKAEFNKIESQNIKVYKQVYEKYFDEMLEEIECLVLEFITHIRLQIRDLESEDISILSELIRQQMLTPTAKKKYFCQEKEIKYKESWTIIQK